MERYSVLGKDIFFNPLNGEFSFYAEKHPELTFSEAKRSFDGIRRRY